MNNKPKISIIIIHYNTPEYLKTCLDAIFAQTYKNIEVIFIDNNSPDKEGLELMKTEYGNHENLKIIANAENTGYAGAANQGIKIAIESQNPSDYVVITNPDIIYTPEYFEKILPIIEKDPKIAGITGKVYKYDFKNKKTTKIVDTVGLFAYKNRRIIDDGQGLTDEGQFDKEGETFGISGACPLYRRTALEDVKIMDEYLDNDFFMYKEDVDLAWRLRLFGWKNYYYPNAVAYHGRGTGVEKRFFTKEVLVKRKKLSKFQRFYSFKNQLLMERKNDWWETKIRHFLPILTKKFLTFFYVLLKEPFLIKSYFEYRKQLPKIKEKHRIIMSKKKLSAKQINKWFGNQSTYLKK